MNYIKAIASMITTTLVLITGYSFDYPEDEFVGSDLELLSKIVYLEAGNQSDDGMLAVANVILNRVESDEFPDTVYEVIYQPKQFQPVGKMDNIEYIPPECIQAAMQALDGISNTEALYFMNPEYSDSGNVSWFESSLEYVGTVGDHEFYK
jgi:N-acetylmuramoyl-L-alanine amidase